MGQSAIDFNHDGKIDKKVTLPYTASFCSYDR